MCTYVQVPAEEGIGFLEAGVMGCCELPDMVLETKLSLKQKQYVLLPTELSLQPNNLFFVSTSTNMSALGTQASAHHLTLSSEALSNKIAFSVFP